MTQSTSNPTTASRLTTNATDYLLDGKPHQIISGSMTYYRMVPEVWVDRLEKLVALGANSLEVYVPWNLHEPRKGEYKFDGLCDLPKFLQSCADAGLNVLFRPGPYICGEWEFGGLPWWLLNERDIVLRSSDPTFLKHVDEWWEQLIPRVLPYMSTNGGPIVAVQVENEYGYYGNDKAYLEHLRDKLRELGVDVLLFTSDGPGNPECFINGSLPDAVITANFGSNPQQHMPTLRKAQPNGPLTCMEFWIGWFDAWGNERKASREPQSAADDLKAMLDMNASVNFFMFCGGTSFGFMSGANDSDGYEPHVTSYDYDALLTECGDVTPKYELCREVIAKHTGRTDLTRTFEPSPKLDLGEVEFTEQVSLTDALPALSAPLRSAKPLPIERLGYGYGYVLYSAEVPRIFKDFLIRIRGMRDFAHVLADGQSLGTWYINDPQPEWTLPVTGETVKLDILVDCMARPNFGHKLKQLKGISDGVYFGPRRHDERAHIGWACYPLPMDADLAKLPWSKSPIDGAAPRFYRAKFNVDTPADTFLALPNCTKGFASINGFNLGRYWEIGPQHTLYIPGPLLKQGENELIVFDCVGQEAAKARLQDKPEWDL